MRASFPGPASAFVPRLPAADDIKAGHSVTWSTFGGNGDQRATAGRLSRAARRLRETQASRGDIVFWWSRNTAETDAA
jgi:hypothetical protein